ncbi:uncharacterized protein [Rutidosis leptorrhynchoides]|uniref:uncharacterized protein n=1 Tax=Rutidosis leptorrhynchoides TaxID=125765 RepID=UPI003A992472
MTWHVTRDHSFQSVVASSDSDDAKDGEDEDEDEEEMQDLIWNMPRLLSQQEEEPEFTTQIPTTYQVRSFVQCCRLIIIVDAAHLKSGYLGTNLVVVAMDELTFIFDRAPSIAHGISNVFPEAVYAFCARHLFMNVKSISSKLKYFKWRYWKMVKAYRASDFQDHLSVFQRRLKVTHKYLQDVGFQKFCRNRAEHVRFSYLTSNSVESINSLSKHARKLPICMLLEFFRASVQNWYFKHHNTSVSLTSTVTPYVECKLAKRTKKSRRWQAIPSTNNLIEVRDGRKNRMVNLEDRVCSCGK